MNPKDLAKIDRATNAFADWKATQEKVAKLEKQLTAEVALYAKGQREFPEQLYAELKELRRQADECFQTAAQALRTAGPNGERTSGEDVPP